MEELLALVLLVAIGVGFAFAVTFTLAYIRDLRGLPPKTPDTRGLNARFPKVSLWLRRLPFSTAIQRVRLPELYRAEGRTAEMPKSNGRLLVAALVGVAILAHAYITQPPRYQFLSSQHNARRRPANAVAALSLEARIRL